MNEDLTWCCIDSRARASNLERRSEVEAASGACLKEGDRVCFLWSAATHEMHPSHAGPATEQRNPLLEG